MAVRLVAALSLVGLFVFAVFLAAGGGGHFTPWQRRLIAVLIDYSRSNLSNLCNYPGEAPSP